MNNQTAKADAGKLELCLVPTEIIEDIAEVRMYAHTKYGDGADHWDEVELERYKNAFFRHFLAYLKDPQGVDAESGIPHYKHMACNMAFICAMERDEADANKMKMLEMIQDESERNTNERPKDFCQNN